MTGPGGAPDPGAVQDPGLQAERTRLAWSRTALAMAVLGALELHPTRVDLPLVDRVPGLVMLLAAVGVGVAGGRRYRSIRRAVAAGGTPASVTSLAVVAVLVLLPAVIGLAAVWV